MSKDPGRVAHHGVVADQVKFSYTDRPVLSSVSFQIATGTVYGLLGENGAGKTTMLSVLAGLLPPDAGDAWLGRHSVTAERLAAQRELGFVPDDPVLFSALTAVEHLELVLDLRADRDSRPQRIGEVLSLVGLRADAERYVGQYSHGMRQRLVLGMALIGRPSCLVLDEPANGLDPGGLAMLKAQLRDVAGSGCAVLLSSHQLDVVRDVCDRVGILHHGKIAAEFTLPAADLDLEQSFLAVTGRAGERC